MSRKALLFSGNRADLGLMIELAIGISEHGFEPEFLLSPLHRDLSSNYDLRRLDQLGFPVTPISGSLTLADASAACLSAAFHALKEMPRDFFAVLGDRAEALAAATGARLSDSLIVHLAGGERTPNVRDDYFRRSISALADYHFVTRSEFRDNLIGSGVEPSSVFVSGELGRQIQPVKLIGSKSYDFIITVHPTGERNEDDLDGWVSILNVIENNSHLRFLWTAANEDPEGDAINRAVAEASRRLRNVDFVENLGSQQFNFHLSKARALIGNSSAGLTEAPRHNIFVLNLGSRQEGRIFGKNAIHLPFDTSRIADALQYCILHQPEEEDSTHVARGGSPAAFIAAQLDKLLP